MSDHVCRFDRSDARFEEARELFSTAEAQFRRGRFARAETLTAKGEALLAALRREHVLRVGNGGGTRRRGADVTLARALAPRLSEQVLPC